MIKLTKQQIFDLEVKYRDLWKRYKEKYNSERFWFTCQCSQNLPEDFIREFQDILDWQKISRYQHLSEDFIREFKNKIDWQIICYSQYLSKDLVEEMKKEGYITNG